MVIVMIFCIEGGGNGTALHYWAPGLDRYQQPRQHQTEERRLRYVGRPYRSPSVTKPMHGDGMHVDPPSVWHRLLCYGAAATPRLIICRAR